MKRIDAKIFFDCISQRETTIWVEDDATDAEIEDQLREEAMELIEFEWYRHDE